MTEGKSVILLGKVLVNICLYIFLVLFSINLLCHLHPQSLWNLFCLLELFVRFWKQEQSYICCNSCLHIRLKLYCRLDLIIIIFYVYIWVKLATDSSISGHSFFGYLEGWSLVLCAQTIWSVRVVSLPINFPFTIFEKLLAIHSLCWKLVRYGETFYGWTQFNKISSQRLALRVMQNNSGGTLTSVLNKMNLHLPWLVLMIQYVEIMMDVLKQLNRSMLSDFFLSCSSGCCEAFLSW